MCGMRCPPKRFLRRLSELTLFFFWLCRSAAEAELNEQWVKQQRDLLLVGLSHFVAQHNEAQVGVQSASFSV